MNVKVTVLRGEDLREKGLGGIYGVGKAAVCPPALAVLSHTPPGANQTIAWVGKGIVYDSGGLSIKSKVFLMLGSEIIVILFNLQRNVFLSLYFPSCKN